MFQSRKDKFKAELQQTITSSYDQIGETVVEVVKDEADSFKRTGNLMNSTDYKVEEGVYIYNTADYATYVEFGTYKSRANPFMRRGIYKSITQIRKIISDNMGVK